MKNQFMNSMTLLATCIFMLTILPLTAADNTGVGYHGANFLRIVPSARQVGMGEAFTAPGHDINTMRFNMAGLGSIEHPSFAANFHNWIDDTQQGSMSFGMPFPFGTFAIDLAYFNEGQINEVNANFEKTGIQSMSGDVLMSVGYGKRVLDNNLTLDIGIGVKYLHQNLVGEITNATGLDAGLQMHLNQMLSVGAAIQNYGLQEVKFDSKQSPLPQTHKFGIAGYLPVQNTAQIMLTGDASWTLKEKPRYYLGSEVLISELFALRGGYKLSEIEASPWAFGFGLYAPMEWLGNAMTRFDYAYAPVQTLDVSTHRFSLHFAFGAMEEKVTAQAGVDDIRRELQEELERARKAREEFENLKEELQRRLAVSREIADRDERIEVVADTTNPKRLKVILRHINFDFDKYNIKPEFFDTMHNIADILNTYPEAQVQVSGHTDWVGDERYNILLSRRRVNSVIDYLVEKENVKQSRFFMPIGYGELRPVATNETAEGRAQNRRVEFMIFSFDEKPEIPEGSGVEGIEVIDNQTVRIVCNGKVEFTTSTLTNPDRFIVDIKNVYLLSEKHTFEIQRGPFIRARLGFHLEDRFTRVVFDLNRKVQLNATAENRYVIVKVQ